MDAKLREHPRGESGRLAGVPGCKTRVSWTHREEIFQLQDETIVNRMFVCHDIKASLVYDKGARLLLTWSPCPVSQGQIFGDRHQSGGNPSISGGARAGVPPTRTGVLAPEPSSGWIHRGSAEGLSQALGLLAPIQEAYRHMSMYRCKDALSAFTR